MICLKLHVKMDHLGGECTLQVTKDRFSWPRMADDIVPFISSTCSYLWKRKNFKIRSWTKPIYPYFSTQGSGLFKITFPFRSRCGRAWVLAISDRSLFKIQARLSNKKQKGSSTAECLFNDFMLRYGIL